MIRTKLALLALLPLFAACATPPPPAPANYATPASMAEAQMRLDVAAAEYEQVAAESTQQAAAATAQAQAAGDIATGTAVAATQTWQSTASALTVQMTAAAIAVQATKEAISANATGTAVAQIAIVEAQLVADEATRIAILRTAEQEQVVYQRHMNSLRPWLWGTVVLALVGIAGAIIYRIWFISQPVRNSNGDVIALPNNQFQLMPSRLIAPSRPEAEEPLLLPQAPQEATLPALTTGHTLVVGPTDAGKSTALRAIIKDRLEAGQQVYVLDPHYQPGSWLSAHVIGGGRDFAEIGKFMSWMMDTLNERATLMAQGNTSFTAQPITVATDEMPAIVDELREGAVVWKKWLREGRKFALFLTVSTQSTRVRTLGIDGEGDVLKNFSACLYLGASAVEAYPDLVRQQQRPAVLRTLRAVQPVIVPHTAPGQTASPPILLTPTSNMEAYQRPENVGLSTPQGFVSPTQIRQIIEMTQQGESGRAIERFVFGYPGGSAYEMRVFVCEAMGISV